MNTARFICLLTGPSGAGKSTIARLLAAKYPTCAHIEVDVLRNFIVSGVLSPFEAGGAEQLMLASQNAAEMALRLQTSGFNVIIDECVVAKERLDQYYRLLEVADFRTFAIMPSLAQVLERDSRRSGAGHMGEKQVGYVHREMLKRTADERRWQLIDTTGLTTDATVDELYRRLNTQIYEPQL